MKPSMLMPVFALLLGCATPKYVMMSSDKLGNTKKYITFVDLPSGERFEFDYPGAFIGTFRNFVCGWTSDRRFRTIQRYEIEAAWTDEKIDPNELDTSSVVKRVILKNGEKILFDEPGACFYNQEQCVKGTALNGEIVTLPVSRIEQGEAFKNFKAVEASVGFQVFFATIGIIGILALKIAVALHDQSN